jgi:hypothetical protein
MMNNRVSKNKYSDIQNANTRVGNLKEVNRHHEKDKNVMKRDTRMQNIKSNCVLKDKSLYFNAINTGLL